jgi:DnaK suppressor protein
MLTEQQITSFRQRVEAELAAAMAALMDDSRPSGAGQVVSQIGHGSRSSAARDHISAARDQMLWKKRRLEAAIVRLEAGTFGLCCQCGDHLATARLEHDPGAPFCDDCQREINIRRRAA